MVPVDVDGQISHFYSQGFVIREQILALPITETKKQKHFAIQNTPPKPGKTHLRNQCAQCAAEILLEKNTPFEIAFGKYSLEKVNF